VRQDPVVHVGIADHLGWAVAVTASREHRVVDRRRLELVEPGVTCMPIHADSKRLDLAATAALLADVRASVERATAASLDQLAAALAAPVTSLSLRTWPDDFPTDLEVLVRVPWEARADAVMYRQSLAAQAAARGWTVCRYEAKHVLDEAAARLGARTAAVLDGPRATLGPPWTKDHRVALAAAVIAASPDPTPPGSSGSARDPSRSRRGPGHR
jgi:hypothetical protein